MVGLTFGRLRVIARAGSNHYAFWKCRCACGNELIANGKSLRSGNTKSCGCLKTETCAERLTTHGLRKRPEYAVWSAAKNRCRNPRDAHYKQYGARGIAMCDEWAESFAAFIRDMGLRPSDSHTLDRIDNNGPYAPGNCRWATTATQMRNQRRNRWLVVDGRRIVMADAEPTLPVTRGALVARLNKGMPMALAVTLPQRTGRKKIR